MHMALLRSTTLKFYDYFMYPFIVFFIYNCIYIYNNYSNTMYRILNILYII